MPSILYKDKVNFVVDEAVPEENKITAEDLNEIKVVVNGKADKGEITGVAGDTIPIGVMMTYQNNTPPNGWLLCDGRAVSRIEYADLFSVVGTRYGEGDGKTTFNLPDKPELDIIIKSMQLVPIVASIEQSLDSESTVNAPSVKAVSDALKDLFKIMYPVGSILKFNCEMNMTEIYGGTWELHAPGRMTVCVDVSDPDFETVGKIGGSKEIQSHAHDGTTSESPDHFHPFTRVMGVGSQYGILFGQGTAAMTTDPYILPEGKHKHTVSISDTGEGDAGNMPPYVTVYEYCKISD